MARSKLSPTRVVSVAEPHGTRFRNRYRVDGELLLESFATEGEAKAAARRFRQDHERETGPTVSMRIEEWIAARVSEGKPDRLCIRFGLRNMLADHMDDVASTLTTHDLEAAYARLRVKVSPKYKRPISVVTHHEAVKWTRAFFRWLVESGKLSKDPTTTIKLVGVKNKRKQQIETEGELLAFKERAFALAEAGDRVALAVLVSLYTGPRSGECRRIEARHVDVVAGNRLVVPGTKTENARRSVRILEPRLWALLVAAAKEATRPDERLMDAHETTLRARVKHIGRDIGLPPDVAARMTFQSLRGMAASLATKGDAAAGAIAALLGQSGAGGAKIMRAHYATEESQATAAGAATFRVLAGGKGVSGGDGMGPNRSHGEETSASIENKAASAG